MIHFKTMSPQFAVYVGKFVVSIATWGGDIDWLTIVNGSTSKKLSCGMDEVVCYDAPVMLLTLMMKKKGARS